MTFSNTKSGRKPSGPVNIHYFQPLKEFGGWFFMSCFCRRQPRLRSSFRSRSPVLNQFYSYLIYSFLIYPNLIWGSKLSPNWVPFWFQKSPISQGTLRGHSLPTPPENRSKFPQSSRWLTANLKIPPLLPSHFQLLTPHS